MALINSTKQTNTNLDQPQTAVTPTQTQATSYQADQREVGDKATVQGQMTSLLDKGGDYMKRAETKGLQMANQRGLLNSSFAVGAAHGAAIDAAMPIAQQDAKTHHSQSMTNQQSNNQAQQFNATADNAASMANQQADNRAQEFNSSQELSKWQTDRDIEAKEFLTRLEQSGRMEQMSAEASANLKGEYVRSWDKMRQDTVIAIEKIQTMQGVDAATKEKLIASTLEIRNADRAALQTIFEQMPQWSQDWAEFTEV
jgi:hypothetical protein